MTLYRFDKKTFNQTFENIKARIELEEERQRQVQLHHVLRNLFTFGHIHYWSISQWFCLQEQLLLNIIPAELAHKMRQSMLERLNEQVDPHSSTRRLWHDFYVREHKGVRSVDKATVLNCWIDCDGNDIVNFGNIYVSVLYQLTCWISHSNTVILYWYQWYGL